MAATETQVGRVIRVGRGWVDVTIEHRVYRFSATPDLLIRPGNFIKIVNDQGVAILPSSQRHTTTRMN